MRSIGALLSMAFLALSLVGCGGSDDTTTPNTATFQLTSASGGGPALIQWSGQTGLNGDWVSMPWTLAVKAKVGDQVGFTAFNADESSDPQEVTLTARILWRGQVVAEDSATGRYDLINMRMSPSVHVATTLR